MGFQHTFRLPRSSEPRLRQIAVLNDNEIVSGSANGVHVFNRGDCTWVDRIRIAKDGRWIQTVAVCQSHSYFLATVLSIDRPVYTKEGQQFFVHALRKEQRVTIRLLSIPDLHLQCT
jgi:hypothetical protein